MGVLVGVGVTVSVGVGVAVIVGVNGIVGVGVTVFVAVANGSTIPEGTKRHWHTVTMVTARGKMITFRNSPNFAATELRKFLSLVQWPLENTATRENCQVRWFKMDSRNGS